MTTSEIRAFIDQFITKKLAERGLELPQDFSEETDLLLSGLIDSLGLLELMTALSDFVGSEIDFEALEPEKMTIVGPLCAFVATSSAQR